MDFRWGVEMTVFYVGIWHGGSLDKKGRNGPESGMVICVI